MENLNFFLFGSLLWLGIASLIIASQSDKLLALLPNQGVINPAIVRLLEKRLEALGIDWQTWQQQANFSSKLIQHLRQGNLEPLTWRELRQVAEALHWSSDQLLTNLGLVSPEISSLPPIEHSLAEVELAKWQQKYQQLAAQLPKDYQQETFVKLEKLFVSYPTAKAIAQVKPDLLAKKLLTMFTPLNHLLQSWGYETIGQVWEQVAYDPQIHEVEKEEIPPGELVYIRFVGYRDGEDVLCRAQVSRNLPSGVEHRREE